MNTVLHNQERSIDQLIQQFAAWPLLNDVSTTVTKNNPFARPMRPQDLKSGIFAKPLELAQLTDNSYLLAQRILTNIYELDLLFLPHDGSQFDLKTFNTFYDQQYYRVGEQIRETLEHHVFSFLDQEVQVDGQWTLERFNQYTSGILKAIEESESSLYKMLTSSKDPQAAGRFFLIQCAGDFLSEASAMGRNVLGNLGQTTSELFKVFIDEYGYGVHHKKHSTIFEALLTELGMSKDIHAYWQFYTASSLALINYCHYISKNHRYFFRYLGALYFTEASLAFVTKGQSKAIKAVFGQDTCTQYFDEHSHIDVHHGRMALENLIHPVVAQYGEQVIPEILLGFEQFRLLQDLADEDLARHIHYHDHAQDYVYANTDPQVREQLVKSDMQFTESQHELSISHMHPVDELFSVTHGEVELILSPDKKITLTAGQTACLPKGILHGSHVLSEQCQYTVTEQGTRQ